MTFIIFWYVTLELFAFGFVPLAPHPGGNTETSSN